MTERDGISTVTSRSVAKEAGCSIQPVFSQFPTMEILRQETFDYVCKAEGGFYLASGSVKYNLQKLTVYSA